MIVVDESNCSGCASCEQICPQKAITMLPNENGFSLPSVDNIKCIKCELCVNTCPLKNKLVKKSVIESYAGVSNSKESKNSTSGGMFYEIARQYIDEGGAVFGASYANNLDVNIIRARDKGDLRKIQGSKYVQANTVDTYHQVKQLIRDGVKVFYSGTPCQIAGLLAYLKNDNLSNLLTAEIICHGVMSPQFFKDYINWIESNERKKLIDYKFRTKNVSHKKDFQCELTFDDGEKKIISGFSDPYYQIFMKSNSLRKSCYNCEFSSNDRVADLTLGDFWNIEDLSYSTIKKGRISAVTCNSEKGLEIIKMISKQASLRKVDYRVVKRGNSNLSRPTSMPADYFEYSSLDNKDNFFQEWKNKKLNSKKEKFNNLPLNFRYLLKKIRRLV